MLAFRSESEDNSVVQVHDYIVVSIDMLEVGSLENVLHVLLIALLTLFKENSLEC